MAERREELEIEAEEALGQANPAAVAIALGRTSRGGKEVDAEATSFLRKQSRLTDLQMENLHEQRDLQLAHLKVRRWKDRLSIAAAAPTIRPRLCSARDRRSFQRRTRRCANCSSRCSCRCIDCSRTRRVCSLSRVAAIASSALPPFDVRASAMPTASWPA